MLDKRTIRKICDKTLANSNLNGECSEIIRTLSAGKHNAAAKKLAETISLSISDCLYEVLKNYDNAD